MNQFPKSNETDETDEKLHRLAPEDRHDFRKLITFRNAEVDLIDKAARHAGLTTSAFIRNAAVVTARKILSNTGEGG